MTDDADRPEPPSAKAITALLREARSLSRRADKLSGTAAAVDDLLLWGAAVGVQDSTVKALVADIVPRERRATAYGIFASVQGAGALIGGVAAGAIYDQSLSALVAVIATVQLAALLLLIPVVRRSTPRDPPP